MNKKFFIPFFLFPFILVEKVFAHCPLCTVGAAGSALWLGVDPSVVGIFIGAFGASIGWWIANKIKKKYIPLQKLVLIILSYLLTVIPILPILKTNKGVYVSLFGNYGSIFNRTYVVDSFFLGSIFGVIILAITPWLSSKITLLRHGKNIPFQGIILTFILLILFGVITQLVVV